MVQRDIQGGIIMILPFFIKSAGQLVRHQQDHLWRQLEDIMLWQ
jgi:hypothetical protein